MVCPFNFYPRIDLLLPSKSIRARSLIIAGCISCKARRVKCDETKPSCNQCTRRRLTCGGYRKDIKWRPVEIDEPIRAHRLQNHVKSPIEQPPTTEDFSWIRLGPLDGSEEATFQSSLSSDLSAWPLSDMVHFDFLAPSYDNSPPWDSFSSLLPVELTCRDTGPPAVNTSIEDMAESIGSIEVGSSQEDFYLNVDRFRQSSLSSPTGRQPTLTLCQGLYHGADSPEGIAGLFHQQTCYILSIQDEPSKNPWSAVIWPLVKDSQALFHALAAMTCFHISKTKPRMRNQGLAHAQCSTRALAADVSAGTIQIDVAVAATLALGFAETWDYQRSSTGLYHIKGAKILLQQALSSHVSSPDAMDPPSRLKFLTNTWIYMDVMARLTSDSGSPPDPELPSLYDMQYLWPTRLELDPLMGYAGTLFPLIGRVADLVAQIRARGSKRNSPAIVSQAITLRREAEGWTSPINLEQVDSPTSSMSDAIQTAEAYRWSTLLLLQEAVPELPNLSSVGELAAKILVYLATTLVESRTTIVQMFPLMVAGSDAAEVEDREFVRRRWKAMSKRMITGLVDRCLEVTEEVWRRRDAYEAERRSGPFPLRPPPEIPENELSFAPEGSPESDSINVSGPERSTTDRKVAEGYRRNAPKPRKPPMSYDFPMSAAFKKGVDPFTRSGYAEYTVRGKLHWLGVMKDWRWEGR